MFNNYNQKPRIENRGAGEKERDFFFDRKEYSKDYRKVRGGEIV